MMLTYLQLSGIQTQLASLINNWKPPFCSDIKFTGQPSYCNLWNKLRFCRINITTQMECYFILLTSYTGQSSRRKHFSSLAASWGAVNLKMSRSVPEQVQWVLRGQPILGSQSPLLSLGTGNNPPVSVPIHQAQPVLSASPSPPPQHPTTPPVGRAGALSKTLGRTSTPLICPISLFCFSLDKSVSQSHLQSSKFPSQMWWQ